MMEKQVIAIDGPAGSGKSTTAAGVARRLGIVHLDTGAMYRALTLAALDRHIRVDEPEKLDALSKQVRITFERNNDGTQRVFLDGRDVSDEIRGGHVSSLVSLYCMVPQVRAAMVIKQREAAQDASVVMEGRDIGTIVFPDARFKFFLTASLEERAKRRLRDLARLGEKADLARVMQGIEQRDRQDRTRAQSPLRQADDAVALDTTGMTVDQQIEWIVDFIKKKS
ncbi:MAG: (d)CMP kinase [Fibrobacterota bacterium]